MEVGSRLWDLDSLEFIGKSQGEFEPQENGRRWLSPFSQPGTIKPAAPPWTLVKMYYSDSYQASFLV